MLIPNKCKIFFSAGMTEGKASNDTNKDVVSHSSHPSDKAEQMIKFKVCLSGQKNVGKTSIFNRLQGKKFSGQPRTTEEFAWHTVDVGAITVKVKFSLLLST